MTDGDDLQQIGGGSDDIDDLLGAYVLDALDDRERAQVEAYLATNPEARAEVDRLAASFDVVVAEDTPELAPPAELWDRIAVRLPPRDERRPPAAIDESPAESGGPASPAANAAPTGDELAARRRSKRSSPNSNTTRIVLAVAAAVVVVVVGLAIVRQSSTKTTSVAQQIQHDAETAATAPGSRSTTLAGPSGASVQVVVDSSGRGYVTPENLPALDVGSTYQLWSVDGGTPVSLGLLGSDPGVTLVAAGTDTTSMAITAEPAGGSPAPTSEIIVSGRLT